jgi:hypothetical protein
MKENTFVEALARNSGRVGVFDEGAREGRIAKVDQQTGGRNS